MDINVVSWNMQGWGSQYEDNAKIKALLRSVGRYYTDDTIIMLQECGDPDSKGMTLEKALQCPDIMGDANFKCYLNYPDPIVRVKRCTTAILASSNLNVEAYDAVYPNGVSRPLIYVIVNGICFGTIHAIANNSESIVQVKACLKWMATNFTSWILMGDFNSEPTDYAQAVAHNLLNEVLISGTDDYPEHVCQMLFSRMPTQGSNGKRKSYLDFAFMSSNFQDEHFAGDPETHDKMTNLKQLSAWDHYLSDHNLIGLALCNL